VIIPLALEGFPHRITFNGRLHPPGIGKLTISVSEPLEYADPTDLFVAKIFLNITLSKLQIDCFVSKIFNNYQSHLFIVVVNILRIFIDLVAFHEGKGVQVLIDSVTMADGITRDVQFGNPQLSGLAKTVDNLVAYTQLLKIIAPNPSFSLSLNDLISAIGTPNQTAINCTRAIEGIRNLIAGDDAKEKTAWSLLHKTLNSDEPYVRFITDLSRQHRHAKREQLDPTALDEALTRSWVLMDRYFALRIRNLEELPIDEFPLLTG
jgi:hypothetical protein